jgi:hypothetical protein
MILRGGRALRSGPLRQTEAEFQFLNQSPLEDLADTGSQSD